MSIRGKAKRFLLERVFTYDGDECLIWPYSRSESGYAKVAPFGNFTTTVVSNIVCEHANGPAPSQRHEAAHSCGRVASGCVTKGHLSWKTKVENAADMVGHGTAPRGENHPQSVLSEKQVGEIRGLKGLVSQNKLAARFGVARSTIYAILAGRSWRNV